VPGDSGSLEGIAVEAGWTSVDAFARVFRAMTGMKPSMVRPLPDEDFAALMNGQLVLPLPKPTRPFDASAGGD
jgi:AraC-like DNA-binding protein